MYVVNTLAPVFLILALGAALRRGGLLSGTVVDGINKLVYWVGLPTLLFVSVAGAPTIGAGAARALVVVLAGTVVAVVLAYATRRLVRVPAENAGTYVQGAFRGNLAYVGLAVIFYAFRGADGKAAADAARTMAVLTLAPMVVVYNIVAVIALLASRHGRGQGVVRRMALGIVTNPLVIACVAGLAVSASGWKLPVFAERTLNLLGQLTLPSALLAIGATLAATRVSGQLLPALGASAIKLLAAPAAGWAVAVLLGASPEVTRVSLILLACPTAVASYVLVDQLGGDSALAAGTIVLSTVLSAIPLVAILALV